MENYKTIWEYRDPRVEDWPFMSSPLPTLELCLIYILIVKILGPAFMRDRPAFKLRRTLLIYNFAQIVLSCYIFYQGLTNGWLGHYSFRCQPVDYSNNPMAIAMAKGTWWYFISKFTEFFDTFFFVLRKKNQHVSLLHVVHHGMMPITGFIGARFAPGGQSTFPGFLNSFVHIFMYTYYLISAMGPGYSRALLPWKKYLTILQLVQFVAIFVHGVQLFFIECDYPIVFAWMMVGHAVLFFFLFSEFYIVNYMDSDGHKQNMKNN